MFLSFWQPCCAPHVFLGILCPFDLSPIQLLGCPQRIARVSGSSTFFPTYIWSLSLIPSSWSHFLFTLQLFYVSLFPPLLPFLCPLLFWARKSIEEQFPPVAVRFSFKIVCLRHRRESGPFFIALRRRCRIAIYVESKTKIPIFSNPLYYIMTMLIVHKCCSYLWYDLCWWSKVGDTILGHLTMLGGGGKSQWGIGRRYYYAEEQFCQINATFLKLPLYKRFVNSTLGFAVSLVRLNIHNGPLISLSF